MLGRPGRWLIVYGAIIAATVWMFAKLPGSFLPEEDQGYFISMVMLPPGATQERTVEVIRQAEEFFLAQPEVEHTVGVVGFSFFGRGQNAGLIFTRLKNWDERKAKESSATAVVQRANMALFGLKQAFIFSVNPPPIPELAAVGGFDFRLQDRGGLGRDKLAEAQALAVQLAGANPALAGVRMEGMAPGPQLLLQVDREKAQTLGVDMATLTTLLNNAFSQRQISTIYQSLNQYKVVLEVEQRFNQDPSVLRDCR